MSYRNVPFSQSPPSFMVQFFHRLCRSTFNRNYFQQLVEGIPNMPPNLVNLIIQRSHEDVFHLEEEDIMDALSGLQEENNKNGASSSSSRSTINEKIMLLDEMDGECSICLLEYKVNEMIRRLICHHKFHASCIERWLLVNNVCPLCRTFAT